MDSLINSFSQSQKDDYLIVAVRNGHLKVVELLLKHGVNFHAWNDRALRWAARNDHLQVVELLKTYK